MAISGKITRFNMHQLPPYERMQQMRARRAEAAAIVQKNANLANGFATIQQNNTQATGDLISKIAMQRMSKRV
ncbi:hypothetical protein [Devosia sediminis]|uniref:Uncharacterized protein n=1 Tax=Devosia sediminis TaxID=2798801 RepID=A0A934MKK5_9HYPH|nr:hypothetical protein [Devosia sediminis]MBJ3783661.1 hypothetical protein [Devosia sediminis]